MPPKPLRPVPIALLVAGAFFMELLDGTIIATALPQMAASFRTNPIDLNIGMTAYMLAVAVFLPASGWVADRFGSRTVFATAIVVFSVASILCGLSGGLETFTAARILQGMGGAMMVPVGRLAVLNHTPKTELMRSIAYITWPSLAAPIIGPPLGGFIATYASWHWIFFLNVPIGVAGVVLALALLPDHKSPEQKPLDGLGFALTAPALFGLMYGFDLVGRPGSTLQTTLLFLVGGSIAAAAAVRHARRHPHPLLDLSVLKVPTYAVTTWGGSMFRIAIGAAPFLLPLLFQIGFGRNAFVSGLLVLSLFAGNVAMKPLTTRILRRFGFRRVLIANGLALGVSIAACAFFSASTPTIPIVIVLFASGMSRSLQFTALNTLAFADIPKSQMSGANTLASMVQQLNAGLGIAGGALALRLALLFGLRSGEGLVSDDFRVAFVVVGGVACLGVLHCLKLSPTAAAEVSGHSESSSR